MADDPFAKYVNPQPQTASIPQMIESAASMAGVPLNIATALVKQESSFNPKAYNPSGASGLTQLLPGTAKDMGVTDIWNPADNLAGGFKYLAQMKGQFGSWGHALAAYNWGPGNVEGWIKKGANMADLPAETRNYVRTIAPDEATNLAQAGAKKKSGGRLELLGRHAEDPFAKYTSPQKHDDPFGKYVTSPSPTPSATPGASPSPVATDLATRMAQSLNPMDTANGPPGMEGPQSTEFAQTALSEISGHQDLPFILHNAQLRDASSGRDQSILELIKDPKSYVSQAWGMYKKDPGQAGDEYGLGSPQQNSWMVAHGGTSNEAKFAKFLAGSPIANAAYTFFGEMGNPMAEAEGLGLSRVFQGARGMLKANAATAHIPTMGGPLAGLAKRGGVEGSQWGKSLVASVAAPHKFLGMESTDDVVRHIFAGLSPDEQTEVVRLRQGLKPDPKFMKQYNDLNARAQALKADTDAVTSQQVRVGRLKPEQVRQTQYFPMSKSYDFGPAYELEQQLKSGTAPRAGGGSTAARPKVFDNMDASKASGMLDADFLPANNYSAWREQRLQHVAFEDSLARAPQSLRRDVAAGDYANAQGQTLSQPWQRTAKQTPDEALQQTVAENQTKYPQGHPERMELRESDKDYVAAQRVLNNTPSPVLKKSMIAPELFSFLADNKGLQRYLSSGGVLHPGAGGTTKLGKFASKFVAVSRNMIVQNFLYHPAVNIAGNDAAARSLHNLGGPQWEVGGYAYNAAKSVAQQAGLDAKGAKMFRGGAQAYQQWLDRALKAGGIAEFGRQTESALGGERMRVLTTTDKTWKTKLDRALTKVGDFNMERTFGEKGEEAFAVSLFRDAVEKGKMSDAQAGQVVRQALGDYYNFDPKSPISAVSLFMPWRAGNWKFWTHVLTRKPQLITGTSHAIRNDNEQANPDSMSGPFARGSFQTTRTPVPWTLPFVGRDIDTIANLAGSLATPAQSGVAPVLDDSMRLLLGSANPLTRMGEDALNTAQASFSPEVQGPETNFNLIVNPKAPGLVQYGQLAKYFASKLPVPLVGFVIQDAARKGMAPQDVGIALAEAAGTGYAGSPQRTPEQSRGLARAKATFKRAYDQAVYQTKDRQALQQAWDTYQQSLRDLGVIH